MRLTVYVTLLLLTSASLSYGQKGDSMAVELLLLKAKDTMSMSKETALQYVHDAETITIASKLKDLEAVSYYTKGSIYDFYNQEDSAEYWFLKWLAIRETQTIQKARWALKGLQEFYTASKQLDKLDAINIKFLEALEKEFCPTNQDCSFKYEVGSRKVISNMVALGGYEKAESYLLKTVKVTGEEPEWYSSDLAYYQIEKSLFAKNDTTELKYWYAKWFESIKELSGSEETIIKTVGILIGKKRWDSDYMIPAIRVLESAYPLLSQESKKKLILSEAKNFKKSYYKKSAGHLVYLTMKVVELSQPFTEEQNKKYADLYKEMAKKRKKMDETSRKELLYVLQKYGITSDLEVISEPSAKLLKKLTR